MESSKKIINNCDALDSIFRYLDFKEHLKLIQICPQFAYAIAHGVWRRMCQSICYSYLEDSDSFLLEYNDENNERRKLSMLPNQFYNILQHTSMYIPKLELENIYDLKNIISFNFYHLRELTLCGIVVVDTELQQVAQNCINLQSFILIRFADFANRSNIRPNVFGKMKALNNLEIYDLDFTVWNYFDVQQLFCLAHLKTLMININIRDSNDNKENNENTTDCVYNIENLTIGELPCLQSANVCFIEDLICFENLTKLSITLKRVSIDDDNLTQINNACPKLCELSFTGCCFKFKQFPRMNNLEHLTLELCSSITLENFDEIFRKLKLKSLSLVGVQVTDEAEDIFNYNYISNTLETLTINDEFDQITVETFFNWQHKFKNVSKVKLEMDFVMPQSTELFFSHNFPYLQELIMDYFYISSEDILHLKHLKVLKFEVFENLSSSYLEILFKHPTLTRITITPNNWEEYRCNGYNCLPKSCKDLTTKLEYLCLPSVVYKSISNFWPSFKERNKLLKLEIFDCDRVYEGDYYPIEDNIYEFW